MYLVLFKWNEIKNQKLIKERGISFQEIVTAINNGHIKKVVDNPTYKEEQMYVIELKHYAYIVPFKRHSEYIELKTIFKSRKHKRIYGIN